MPTFLLRRRALSPRPRRSPFCPMGEGGGGEGRRSVAIECIACVAITSNSQIFAFILPLPPSSILLCQALGPAAPCPICAVDCSQCQRRCRGWESARAIEWQAYAQGEYVGHARTAHVPEYRLRVDDQLDMIYRITRQEQPNPYRLNVGDEISVESFTDNELNRNLLIQPDGTITLAALGPSSRHGPHGHATPRRARGTLQKILQSAGHHRDAAEGQHEAGRPAGDGRSPGGHRRAEPIRPRHARRHHFAAGHRLGARPRA